MRSFLITVCFIFTVSLQAFAERYDDIILALNQYADAYPNNTELFSLGLNDQGKGILGIKLQLNPGDKNVVNHLLVGVHHGNEGDTASLSLRFIEDVLNILNNPQDPLYLDYHNYVLHVVPVLNISGYNRNYRRETLAAGGTVDPNRDYPDACYNNQHYRLKSTYLLSKYIENEDIIGAVTAHGYIGTFTFPWGTYANNTHTMEHDFFYEIAELSVVFNNYRIGTHSDIIYPAIGSFEDWAYYEHGIWSMLIEMEYSANIADDSKVLLKFFSLLPSEKSTQNEHGECREVLTSRDYFRSRP